MTNSSIQNTEVTTYTAVPNFALHQGSLCRAMLVTAHEAHFISSSNIHAILTYHNDDLVLVGSYG
jgi:hypothetical protein